MFGRVNTRSAQEKRSKGQNTCQRRSTFGAISMATNTCLATTFNLQLLITNILQVKQLFCNRHRCAFYSFAKAIFFKTPVLDFLDVDSSGKKATWVKLTVQQFLSVTSNVCQIITCCTATVLQKKFHCSIV